MVAVNISGFLVYSNDGEMIWNYLYPSHMVYSYKTDTMIWGFRKFIYVDQYILIRMHELCNRHFSATNQQPVLQPLPHLTVSMKCSWVILCHIKIFSRVYLTLRNWWNALNLCIPVLPSSSSDSIKYWTHESWQQNPASRYWKDTQIPDMFTLEM